MATRQLFQRAFKPGSPACRVTILTSVLYSPSQSQWHRAFATGPSPSSSPGSTTTTDSTGKGSPRSSTSSSISHSTKASPSWTASTTSTFAPSEWEEDPDFSISSFAELPSRDFGVNQHMIINAEFKEALRQVLWKFKAPIRYAFAYGSGVFPQSKPGSSSSSGPSLHPKPPPAVVNAQRGNPKMIDFIFGVTHTEHWHSLNLHQHPEHYSALRHLGSGVVSKVQDKWGAGVYFNPYVEVDGILIKYGVVNIDTLCTDLSQWSTLYTAGRLQKPVKILRDDARVRLANQINLISALRTALLLLPPAFTELELYGTIASISYMGDPRMALPTEDPGKVANIVGNNLPNFRRLYAPLIENLPNMQFNDPACTTRGWMEDPKTNLKLEQDMDPAKRGNMVRRLPKAFRAKLYFQYQEKYQIPQLEFNELIQQSKDEDSESFRRRQGGPFERRIATEPSEDVRNEVRRAIKKTISWPSTSQSVKGVVTAGFGRTWRYMSEKMAKHAEGKKKAAEAAAKQKKAPAESSSKTTKTS